MRYSELSEENQKQVLLLRLSLVPLRIDMDEERGEMMHMHKLYSKFDMTRCGTDVTYTMHGDFRPSLVQDVVDDEFISYEYVPQAGVGSDGEIYLYSSTSSLEADHPELFARTKKTLEKIWGEFTIKFAVAIRLKMLGFIAKERMLLEGMEFIEKGDSVWYPAEFFIEGGK